MYQPLPYENERQVMLLECDHVFTQALWRTSVIQQELPKLPRNPEASGVGSIPCCMAFYLWRSALERWDANSGPYAREKSDVPNVSPGLFLKSQLIIYRLTLRGLLDLKIAVPSFRMAVGEQGWDSGKPPSTTIRNAEKFRIKLNLAIQDLILKGQVWQLIPH